MTLLAWAIIILLAATLIAGVDEYMEKRDRRRRLQRLRDRRRYLDSLPPQRWSA